MDLPRSFYLVVLLLFCLIWIFFITFFLLKKRSFLYLLFFTIFYIYLFKVLDYTLLQFQSLLLLKYFMPHLILHGEPAGKTVNLIPLITLTPQDVKTSLLNILLFVPFGFGLPFITRFTMRKVIVAGGLFSIVIELLQLVTGVIARITFRIADINDVIFNTIGVMIGFMLFIRFVHLYRGISHNKKQLSANSLSRYILERPQVNK